MPEHKLTYSFVELFEKFIRDSRTGCRLQPNGKIITKGTVSNYFYTLLILRRFINEKKFDLRLKSVRQLTTKELSTERKYWQRFYKKLMDYLYRDCGYFDNYAGLVVKNIRTFFSYLNKDLSLGVGDFHKLFYVRREEIAIFPLMPEELHYLIHDHIFEESLTKRMKEVKDFFVFGCTVALRFSDLVRLQKSHVRISGGTHYLSVRSTKTGTDSIIKLPPYTVKILGRYDNQRIRLLPKFNIVNLNKYIKQLLEQAGFTQPVHVTRNRRGIPVKLRDKKKLVSGTRFCDVATTHTMRRTAITTMLNFGIPEQLVRKISGHSPNGKEFYRYVSWPQTYQDKQLEKMFAKLDVKDFSCLSADTL